MCFYAKREVDCFPPLSAIDLVYLGLLAIGGYPKSICGFVNKFRLIHRYIIIVWIFMGEFQFSHFIAKMRLFFLLVYGSDVAISFLISFDFSAKGSHILSTRNYLTTESMVSKESKF